MLQNFWLHRWDENTAEAECMKNLAIHDIAGLGINSGETDDNFDKKLS